MKNFKMFTLITLITSASAFAGGFTPFSELDTDNSGSLSMQEAAADSALAQKFEQLDTNKDGQLSEAEYNAG
ncbi:hypothetical protein [Neptunicella marina]|uniref:EF-hand domain-containing protein n=1 Tax=Neptunicella marina TaxID=2125989 RepID=A0A8J6IUE4_9ALTE|nr:hypothetical protein [Neptunicella marina]MBC3765643.1 hypothetical protein [Neptunicella marina]